MTLNGGIGAAHRRPRLCIRSSTASSGTHSRSNALPVFPSHIATSSSRDTVFAGGPMRAQRRVLRARVAGGQNRVRRDVRLVRPRTVPWWLGVAVAEDDDDGLVVAVVREPPPRLDPDGGEREASQVPGDGIGVGAAALPARMDLEERHAGVMQTPEQRRLAWVGEGRVPNEREGRVVQRPSRALAATTCRPRCPVAPTTRILLFSHAIL
ncbi:unnamed protein product [Urochloa humidicola]